MKETYNIDEIPGTIKTTIYTCYCFNPEYSWDAGTITHTNFDRTGDRYLLLGTSEIEVEVPPIGDVKMKVIQALNQEKKNIMVEHERRLAELQDKIDQLLCIEYKG